MCNKALRKRFPDEAATLSDNQLTDLVGDVVQKMADYQVQSIRHVHTIAAWQLIYGSGFKTRALTGYIGQILNAAISEEQKMVHLKRRLDGLHSEGLL